MRPISRWCSASARSGPRICAFWAATATSTTPGKATGPPDELTARLLLGRARGLARQHREQEAESAYAEILLRFPRSYVAPEAAYWQAVCRYKRTHEPDDLLGGWARTLHTRYPDSQWRTAQAWAEPPLRW
jgi:TolA-binding protein